jgi:WD40 repeat protein
MATISASGHRIVAATRHGVEVFDSATGVQLGAIPGDDLRATFITVGDQFFVASLSGELVQYDLDTLEPIQSFGGSRGAIQELYRTTDGSTIAVRGGDGVVTLVDVASGVQVGPAFTMTPDDQLYASLAIDGSTLTYGGGLHSAIRVVDLDPETWIDAACRIAGRNLTAAEWATYVGDLAEHRPTCQRFPFED